MKRNENNGTPLEKKKNSRRQLIDIGFRKQYTISGK